MTNKKISCFYSLTKTAGNLPIAFRTARLASAVDEKTKE